MDSGADVSLIREDILNKLHADSYTPIQNSSVTLSAISGHSLQCLGETTISLGIAGIFSPHKFHVIPKQAMAPPVLLGDTFLLANEVIIDRKANVLIYQSIEVPYLCMHELNHGSRKVSTRTDVQVPPRSTMLIECTIAPVYASEREIITHDYSAIFSSHLSPEAEESLYIPAGVMQTCGNTVSLPVANYTDRMILMYTNEPIGVVSPPHDETIHEVCHVSAVESHTSRNTGLYDVIIDEHPVNGIGLSLNHEVKCVAKPMNTPPVTPPPNLNSYDVGTPPPSDSDEDNSSPNYQNDIMPPIDLSESDLSKGQLVQVQKLMFEFRDIFSTAERPYGRTDLVSHTIDTGFSKPVKQRAYRVSPAMRLQIDKQIEMLLSHDLIQPSDSPYSSPLLLIKKKNKDEWRCLVDFRKINAQTIVPAHPLNRTDDILDTLAGNCLFSCMDFASGFFQVPMDADDAHKTAFAAGSNLYEFKVMPQGLSGSPGTFSHLMEKVLRGLNWRTCVVYLDDVCVYGESFQQHFDNLRATFLRFRQANLTLRPNKCHFFQSKITFLGHVVTGEGVQPDPSNLSKVKDWPRPKNVKQVRGFLGLAGYYRRFIKGFSEIARPLTVLTKKDVPFIWSEVCKSAFLALREALVSEPIVSHPNHQLPFVLTCDASNIAVGAVLSQIQDGVEKVIAYHSSALSDTEQRYCAFDREFLAIVSGVRKFKHYLAGSKFTIYTDHRPLVNIRTMQLSNLIDPHNRRSRWVSEISPLDCDIKYKPGSTNIIADQLSRLPMEQNPDIHEPNATPIISSVNLTETTSYATPMICALYAGSHRVVGIDPTTPVTSQHVDLDSFLSAQSQDLIDAQSYDPAIQTVKRYVTGDTSVFSDSKDPWFQSFKRHVDSLFLGRHDNVLYYSRPEDTAPDSARIVIPRSWVPVVLHHFHGSLTSGHPSFDAAYDAARKVCFWPSMNADFKKHCKACIPCQKFADPVPRYRAPLRPIKATRPFQIVSMDITELPVSSQGNRYVLTVNDLFTKYIRLYAIPNQTTETVAKCFFENFVLTFGVPESLLTDRGGQFESGLFKKLCEYFGLHKLRTTPYMPSADGQAERINRSFKDQIARILQQFDVTWDTVLKQVEFNYNSRVHSTTKYSPYFLMFGRHPRLPVHVLLGRDPNAAIGAKSSVDYASLLASRLASTHAHAEENITKAQIQQAKYYDKTSRYIEYKVGDKVLLKNPRRVTKLSPKYLGPYTVNRCHPNGRTFELMNHARPGSKPMRWHFNKLKPIKEFSTSATPSGYEPDDNWGRVATNTVTTVSPTPPPCPHIHSPPMSVTITPQAGVVDEDEVIQPPDAESVAGDDTGSFLSSRSNSSSLDLDFSDLDDEDILFDRSSYDLNDTYSTTNSTPFQSPVVSSAEELSPSARSGRRRFRPNSLRGFVTY